MSLTGRTALVVSPIAVSLAEAGFAVVGTDLSLSDSVKQNNEKIKEMQVTVHCINMKIYDAEFFRFVFVNIC